MQSRRLTRFLLVEYLYARTFRNDVHYSEIVPLCVAEKQVPHIDHIYADAMQAHIFLHEEELLGTISALAPKFDPETMPRVHLVILMIALAEMRYWKGGDIDLKVSVNEAVELAKQFSDEQGKNFINGVLATFVRDSEPYIQAPRSTFRIFK